MHESCAAHLVGRAQDGETKPNSDESQQLPFLSFLPTAPLRYIHIRAALTVGNGRSKFKYTVQVKLDIMICTLETV